MRRSRDYLINNGAGNIYFLLVVALVTLVGALYIFRILPPYDPSILAQPPELVFVEYVGLFLGGVGVFVSFWFKNRVVGLTVQLVALILQTASIYLALITAVAASFIVYGGAKAALFIMIWGITFAVMHTYQIFWIKRERKNAPIKRELAKKVDPIVEESGTRSDLMLQALIALQKKNEELEAQFSNPH